MIAVVAAPLASAAGITILVTPPTAAGAQSSVLLPIQLIVKKANVRHLCLLAPLGTTVGATNVPQITPKVVLNTPVLFLGPAGSMASAADVAPKNWMDAPKTHVHSPTPTGSMVSAASALPLRRRAASLNDAHLLLPLALQ